MRIRNLIVTLAVVGSFPSISALIPVNYTNLNIPCTGAPRFGEYLFSDGSFCENLPTCLINGGRKIGYCTARGICCLVTATCGKTISTIFGYFISDGYPSSTASTSGDCEVTIRPFDERVCQVRLDFVDFQLAGPNSTGHCVTDSFEVIGSDFNYPVPVICGSNTNQHMYLDFVEGEIKLRLRATNRRWLIRITQIRCLNIAALAPAGCLQYFTVAAGSVSSFNYVAGGARNNLALQDYEVCLSRTSAMATCTFTWTTSSSTFNISDTVITPSNYADSRCDDDYISILGGTATINTTITARRDRHCGNLGAATSSLTITTMLSERLRVFFNNDAVGSGFRFTFSRACT